jgi:hypothetical protein
MGITNTSIVVANTISVLSLYGTASFVSVWYQHDNGSGDFDRNVKACSISFNLGCTWKQAMKQNINIILTETQYFLHV